MRHLKVTNADELDELPIEAFVRAKVRSLDGPRFRETILPLPQVIAADHVTGDECW